MKPTDFRCRAVVNLEQALDFSADDRSETRFIAGSQSLGPMLNLRLARPDVLVDVSRLAPLRTVQRTDTHVEIGAALRHGEIEDGAIPDPIPGMLPYIAHGIAYRAVRNRGTIGGSICHADPAADWITSLVALDASLDLVSAGGVKRTVLMRDFMKGAYRTAINPDELLQTIKIPIYSKSAVWGYYKVTRKVGEFADAIACWVADPQMRYSRLVFGSTAGAPLISSHIAALIASSGKCPDHKTIQTGIHQLAPELDEVKKRLLSVACKRCVEGALANA